MQIFLVIFMVFKSYRFRIDNRKFILAPKKKSPDPDVASLFNQLEGGLTVGIASDRE